VCHFQTEGNLTNSAKNRSLIHLPILLTPIHCRTYYRYRVCHRLTENKIGEAIFLEDSKLRCAAAKFNGKKGNPSIMFSGNELPKTLIRISNKEDAKPIDTQYIKGAIPAIQEILVTSDLSDPICSSLANPGNPVDAVFAKFNGNYWIHDPRFVSSRLVVSGPNPSVTNLPQIVTGASRQ
jgi:hypothetical protein